MCLVTNQELTKAYQDGQEANLRGIPAHNPYIDRELFAMWNKGWIDQDRYQLLLAV